MQIKRFLVILPIVALIAAGCSSKTTDIEPEALVARNTNLPPAGSGNTNTPSSQTVAIEVVGKNFGFSVSTIKVKKGDTVKLTFKNEVGTHDWVVDEFNAHTKIVQGGQSDTIEFVANKTGSFEYYCSVGTHRQMGMKGTLIVE